MDVNELLEKINQNTANQGSRLADIEKREEERQNSLKAILDRLNAVEKAGVGSRAVSLGLDEHEKGKHPFSFARAALAIAYRDQSLAPMEWSMMKEAGAKYAAMGETKKRVMSTDLDDHGGFIVPNEYVADLIELIYAREVVSKLGATAMNGLTGGPVQIPRQTSGTTAAYVAENAQITPSDPLLGQVTMQPREVAAMCQLSNRLLRMSSPAAEAVVRADLARQIALRVDLSALRGTGGTQPLGVVNTPGIGATTMTAVPTVNALYAMMYVVELANADTESMGWAMHPRTWNTLRTIQDGEGRYILATIFGQGTQEKRGPIVGTLLGHPFYCTTQIPITLGAGAASEIYFGNWADLILAEWMGLELMASQETSTAFAANQTWIRAILEHDCAVRHPASFCVDGTVAV
jgi:HK97 family phage major capsid protein